MSRSLHTSLLAVVAGGTLGLGGFVLLPSGSAAAADIVATSPTSGTVPDGICYAEVSANGGSGRFAVPGPIDTVSGQPGSGASLTAKFPVTAGEPYAITFAKGGAAGPDLGVGNTGGAGGDAAAVSFSGVVHLAAGGGGGAGGVSSVFLGKHGETGGAAGAFGPGNLKPGEWGGPHAFPDAFWPNIGQGGMTDGTGGHGHPDASPGHDGASNPGGIAAGGAGGAGDPGSVVTPSGPSGGGGGAGYGTGAGGGGGANNSAGSGSSFDANIAGGGGGGTSYVHSTFVDFTGGLVSIDEYTASASITWIACPPASTTTSSTTTSTTVAPVDSAPVDSAPVDSVPADSTTTTEVAGGPATTTTDVGNSAGGGPRSLPTTGSTSGALLAWSSIVLLLGAVLMSRSRRPA